MKKVIAISSLVAMFASFSAFGQGYFNFAGGSRQVWDGFTVSPLAPLTTNNVRVAFMIGANGAVPSVEALNGNHPNDPAFPGVVTGVSSNTTVATSTYSTTAAWALIMNDANFKFATNAANGALASTNSNVNGSFQYFSGAQSFGVTNTTPATTYTLFVIGWDAQYADPFAAALANSYVGWSAAFNNLSVAFGQSPNAMVYEKIGVAGTVPEPTTFALAGLGAASLLIFRRRKQS